VSEEDGNLPSIRLRLDEAANELEALLAFMPGIESGRELVGVLWELERSAEALGRLVLEVGRWGQRRRDELFDTDSDFAAQPDALVDAIQAVLQTAGAKLVEGVSEVLADARRAAARLELRAELEVDLDDPDPALDHWYVVELVRFDHADTTPETGWRIADAAMWRAAQIAQEVTPNEELHVRVAGRTGLGATIATVRGRANECA
jgi:hypothetical protein